MSTTPLFIREKRPDFYPPNFTHNTLHYRDWSHAFVQSAFVGQLINRRNLYSTGLRQVLARNLTLRHKADYDLDLVTQRQAERAIQRTRDFVGAIREQIDDDEG